MPRGVGAGVLPAVHAGPYKREGVRAALACRVPHPPVECLRAPNAPSTLHHYLQRGLEVGVVRRLELQREHQLARTGESCVLILRAAPPAVLRHAAWQLLVPLASYIWGRARACGQAILAFSPLRCCAASPVAGGCISKGLPFACVCTRGGHPHRHARRPLARADPCSPLLSSRRCYHHHHHKTQPIRTAPRSMAPSPARPPAPLRLLCLLALCTGELLPLLLPVAWPHACPMLLQGSAVAGRRPRREAPRL